MPPKPHKRPELHAATVDSIPARRGEGESIRAIAKGLHVSTTTVQKVLTAAQAAP
jgi:hypothetical protein